MFDGGGEVYARTSQQISTVSESVELDHFLSLAGTRTGEIRVSGERIDGRADELEFSFTHTSSAGTTLSPGGLNFSAETSFSLAGDVPAWVVRPPSVRADYGGDFEDGIVIVTGDPSLYGVPVEFDLEVRVAGTLAVGLGSAADTEGQGLAEFRFHGGNTDKTYTLQKTREGGADEVTSTIDPSGSISEVLTIRWFATLRPYSYILGDDVRYDPIRMDFNWEASAAMSGPSGQSASASVNVTCNSFRITNVVAWAGGGTPVDPSSLTSVSQSGYDWIGTGTPVEPPDEHRWDNPGGGSFGIEGNWDTGAVPGSESVAIVEIPGTYAIDVGTREVGRLRAGGDLSFNAELGNAGLTVGATSLVPPGVDIDLGTARFTGGTIGSVHAKVGRSAATNVEIDGAETTWINTGRFTAGAGGETEVRVINGGRLVSGETFVGDGATVTPAVALLVAREFGSKIELGNAQVGLGGHGYVQAREGGEVTGGEVRLALNPGVVGQVASVGHGPGGAGPSNVELDLLVAGYGGEALVIVEGGGELTAQSMVVGPRGSGSVFVRNPGSILRAPVALELGGRHLVAGEIENSPDAFGYLEITDGGKVIAGDAMFGGEVSSLGMTIGTVADGSVLVDGETGATRPELEVLGGLTVGHDGSRPEEGDDNGSLDVANGGLVDADSVTVASNEGADGLIELRGENAGRGDVAELRVSDDLDLGGYSFLPPSDGLGKLLAGGGARVSVTGAINLGNANRGEMEISGTRESRPDQPTAVTANTIRVGRRQPGHITVASLATLDSLTMGLGVRDEFVFEGDRPEGTLDIVDGGQVAVGDLLLNVGSEPGASGSVIVTGWTEPTSSTLRAESIVVGPDSELQVLDRGQVRAGALTVEGGGQVFVEGGDAARRSRVIVSGDLTLGGSFGNESFLGVDGDAVVAVEGDVVHTTGATMCIDGSLVTDQVFAAGFLELGCSLGAATIDGDFTLATTGVLEVEVRGTAPVTEHDTMIVTGDVDLQGTVRIVFSGYAPREGDQILFLDVGGGFSASGLKTHVVGLQPGFEAAFEHVGETVALRALTDGELLTPGHPVELFDPSADGAGGFGFSFLALEGTEYRVDQSTDLRTWTEVGRVAGTGEILRYQRTADAGETVPAPEAFFRVVPMPEPGEQ